MRSVPRVLVVTVLSCLILTGAAGASGKTDGGGAAPPARVLTSLDLPGVLQRYCQNDVGMMLVYAGGRLHRIDLLQAAPEPLDAVDFPEVTKTGSVVPIAGTGLRGG